MGDLIAASTTDPLSEVRRTVGLSPEPTEEEKREPEQMQTERRENGHRRDPEESPRYQRRFDQIFAQKSEAERRASRAEIENAELRQRLAEFQGNGHMDRALAAEARASELEERLRAYEHGANGYEATPQSLPDEPPPDEIPTTSHEAPPIEEPQQHAQPDHDRAARQQAHQKRFLDMVNNRPDADQLIERFVKIPVSPELEKTLSKVMLDTPNSAELAMHLLENPDVMEKIARLSPNEAQWELARLSGRLEASNGQSRPVVLSKAPPPIGQLSGHPTRQPLTLDDPNISQADFRRIRDKQEKDWKRGVGR
jgi:hypothetical protein